MQRGVIAPFPGGLSPRFLAGMLPQTPPGSNIAWVKHGLGPKGSSVHTTTLGRTNLQVSVAGLGTGGFSRLGLAT